MLRTGHFAGIGNVLEDPKVDVHVPSLCDVEVASVLRRALLVGSMDETRQIQAVQDYLDLPLTRHGHASLIPEVLRLRENFSAYDATYVVLAHRLGGELLTADVSLARAVNAHLELPTIPIA